MPPKSNPPLQPASLSTSANLGTLPGRIKRARRWPQDAILRREAQPDEFYGLGTASQGAQRELNQLEVYRANLRALDSYVRRPLDGKLTAFEILETTEGQGVAQASAIDWAAYWQGSLQWHLLPHMLRRPHRMQRYRLLSLAYLHCKRVSKS